MPYNFFKEIKIKCNYCNSIIVSKSDTTWVECPCGNTSVLGKSFMKVKGENWTNLTLVAPENVPEHRGWNDKSEDYYNKEQE